MVDILLINDSGTKLIEKPYLAKGEGTWWSIFIRRGRGSCVQNLNGGYVLVLFLHIFSASWFIYFLIKAIIKCASKLSPDKHYHTVLERAV